MELGLQIAVQEALKNRLNRHQCALAIGSGEGLLQLATLLGITQQSARLIEQLGLSGANADCGAGGARGSGGLGQGRQRQLRRGAGESGQLLQQGSHGFIALRHNQGEQGAAVQPVGPALELFSPGHQRFGAELIAAQGQCALICRHHQHQGAVALAGALAMQQITDLLQAALFTLEQQQLSTLGDSFNQLLPVGNAGVEHQQGAARCFGAS